jgi:hypothetical protein
MLTNRDDCTPRSRACRRHGPNSEPSLEAACSECGLFRESLGVAARQVRRVKRARRLRYTGTDCELVGGTCLAVWQSVQDAMNFHVLIILAKGVKAGKLNKIRDNFFALLVGLT